MTLTVIAASAAAASIAQQQQQAHAANDYEKLLYGQRKEAAFETFAALREREFQEREKAAHDIRAVTAQARQAAGAAKLQALESGTGGASVSMLLEQFERAQLSNVGVVQSNLAATSRQLHNEAVAAGHLQGPAKTIGPLDTPLGIITSGLQVAGAGAGAYASAKPPTTVG